MLDLIGIFPLFPFSSLPLLLIYSFWVIGFFFAVRKRSVSKSIGRVQFLVSLSFLFISVALIRFLFFLFAMRMYIASPIFIMSVLGGLYFAYGYYLSIIARRRFLDAFGSTKWAFLILIPFSEVVMVLVARKPESKIPRLRPSSFEQWFLGVVIGITLVATIVGLQYIDLPGFRGESSLLNP
ncbi:MAG: hypothetical protein ACPGOY_14495 [Rhodospirillaceae bacterium]